MIEADKEQRKVLFQKALDGADDDLFVWAAHHFYVQAKIRFLQMPWDVEHPASVYTTQYLTQQEIKTALADAGITSSSKAKVAKADSVDEIMNSSKYIVKNLDVNIEPDPWTKSYKAKKKTLKEKLVEKYKPNPAQLVWPLFKDHATTLEYLNKLYGTKFTKWVAAIDAPIVKKKAYNPISLHIPKGAYVLYSKPASPDAAFKTSCGIVKSFGKHYLKIDKVLGEGNKIETAIPYDSIKFVAVK